MKDNMCRKPAPMSTPAEIHFVTKLTVVYLCTRRYSCQPNSCLGIDFMSHFTPDDVDTVYTWGRNINRLNCAKDRFLERYLAPYDITAAQFKVMLLMNQKRASTSAELCRCISLDSGAMSRMLDRLENKNMIMRVRSTADRRQHHLALTEKGQLFCQEIGEIAVKAFNDLLAPLTPVELNEFDRLLKKLAVLADI
nr:MarR family transcriptional regulator [Sodalis sp. dw_96]